jgi:probable F420-dependent oxidoreductase
VSGEVRFGVLLPTREALLRGVPEARPLLELAERAERAGFDSVWAGESMLARPRLEPLSLLAAAATRTSRITVGTAVLLGALRPPAVLAHTAATVDRIAGGRLVVGLGAGFPYPGTEAEFRAVGVPFRERVGRLDEAARICRLLWADDGPASHEGRYWRLRDVELLPRPERDGGPPLWLAGATEKALRRAGRLFDGWLPYPPAPEQFASGWEQVQAAAAEAGRPEGAVTPGLYVTVSLDDDERRAQAELDRYASAYYGVGLEVISQLQSFHGGGVEDCAEWIARYVEAGARHVIIRFGTLSDPRPMLERAAAELLPALRAPAPAAEVAR